MVLLLTRGLRKDPSLFVITFLLVVWWLMTRSSNPMTGFIVGAVGLVLSLIVPFGISRFLSVRESRKRALLDERVGVLIREVLDESGLSLKGAERLDFFAKRFADHLSRLGGDVFLCADSVAVTLEILACVEKGVPLGAIEKTIRGSLKAIITSGYA